MVGVMPVFCTRPTEQAHLSLETDSFLRDASGRVLDLPATGRLLRICFTFGAALAGIARSVSHVGLVFGYPHRVVHGAQSTGSVPTRRWAKVPKPLQIGTFPKPPRER